MLTAFHTVLPFAQFCAELVRQGIAFEAGEYLDGTFFVKLTGF